MRENVSSGQAVKVTSTCSVLAGVRDPETCLSRLKNTQTLTSK